MGTKRPSAEPSTDEGNVGSTADTAQPKSKKLKTPDSSMVSAERDEMPNMPRSYGIRVDSDSGAMGKADEAKALKPGDRPYKLKTFCHHDVSLPKSFEGDYDFESLTPPEGFEPAKKYDFVLDAFQRESIKCLERNESVLVAAHTSAGKTVVAEYAIAIAKRENQRVIYTSPIKALSNQKFRELEEQFGDVGLMTGDVTINKNASCLVMTTEILRSMLYRGSEIVREVSWVIFDEVHYMRDRERGVVWEETIILVPQSVRFVFLSATIPNAREFSEWIAQLKDQPCHTIYTDTRPVPLKHYLFPAGGKALHPIVDEKGNFSDESFNKAMNELGASKTDTTGGNGAISKKRSRGPQTKGKSDCFKVVKMIMERSFQPVIVFSFSRRDCEALAVQTAKLAFNNDSESANVTRVFNNAIDTLNTEDQKLPQVLGILPLLQSGIGIHHSGLLPIIKETVEVLFQEGLLKCLFATETFSMGLNMPARTVVFTAVRKYDGSQFRHILGGEYVQMSGRAGRRGIDSKGIAILMCDEKIEPQTAKSIMSGTSEPLRSTFKLGYNMLLNLMRSEEANPEYVIGRSLAQFQADRSRPEKSKKLKQLEEEKEKIKVGGGGTGVTEQEVKVFVKLQAAAESARSEIRAIIQQPSVMLPFLQSGRLTRVKDRTLNLDYGWGAVAKYERRATKGKKPDDERYVVHVLLCCTPGSNKGRKPQPVKPRKRKVKEENEISDKYSHGEWMVVKCSLKDLDGLSALRVFKPGELEDEKTRSVMGRSVHEVLRRFPDGPPMLDPFSDLAIKDEKLPMLMRKLEAIDEAIAGSKVSSSARAAEVVASWKRKLDMIEKVKVAKKELKFAEGIILRDELRRMKRVLKRLGFTNDAGVVEVKGRVACEINSADELVITELLLGGNLNDMPPEVLVALCSCFVIDEGKINENLKLEKELQDAYTGLRGVATRVATVAKESNIPVDVETFVDSFNPAAMRSVYFWCQGQSFTEVCALADLFEGSVIRCFRRLEELLRQLIAAVKSIGNTELQLKFEEGSKKLKRGIAFHASLYI